MDEDEDERDDLSDSDDDDIAGQIFHKRGNKDEIIDGVSAAEMKEII